VGAGVKHIFVYDIGFILSLLFICIPLVCGVPPLRKKIGSDDPLIFSQVYPVMGASTTTKERKLICRNTPAKRDHRYDSTKPTQPVFHALRDPLLRLSVEAFKHEQALGLASKIATTIIELATLETSGPQGLGASGPQGLGASGPQGLGASGPVNSPTIAQEASETKFRFNPFGLVRELVFLHLWMIG
jgi:hypothetical protein